MPLSSVLAAQRVALGVDALAGPPASHSLAELDDPGLVAALGSREPGGWALAPDAIGVLRREYEALRSHVVLEFGSGLSTLCLAYFASRLDRR